MLVNTCSSAVLCLSGIKPLWRQACTFAFQEFISGSYLQNGSNRVFLFTAYIVKIDTFKVVRSWHVIVKKILTSGRQKQAGFIFLLLCSGKCDFSSYLVGTLFQSSALRTPIKCNIVIIERGFHIFSVHDFLHWQSCYKALMKKRHLYNLYHEEKKSDQS